MEIMEVNNLSTQDLERVIKNIVNGTDTIFYNVNDVVSAIIKKSDISELTYLYIYESNCDIHLKDAASEIFWNKYVKRIEKRHSAYEYKLVGLSRNNILFIVYPILYCDKIDKQKWISIASRQIISSGLSGVHLDKFKSEYADLFEQMCYTTLFNFNPENTKIHCNGYETYISSLYSIGSEYWKRAIVSTMWDYLRHRCSFGYQFDMLIEECSSFRGSSLGFMGEKFATEAVVRFLEMNKNKSVNVNKYLKHSYDGVFDKIVEYKKRNQSEISVYVDILNHCGNYGFSKNDYCYPRVRQAIEFIVANCSSSDYNLAKEFAINGSAFDLPTIKNGCVNDSELKFFDNVYILSKNMQKEFEFDKFARKMGDISKKYAGLSDGHKIGQLIEAKNEIEARIEILKNKKSWKQN